MQKIKNIALLTMPIAFFLLSIWLIFKRVQGGVSEEIDKLIRQNKYEMAKVEIARRLAKDKINRPKLLMYGSISSMASNGKPDYLSILVKEDSTGIFVQEVFYRLIALKPGSPALLHWFSRYKEIYKNKFLTSEQKVAWQKAFSKKTTLDLNFNEKEYIRLFGHIQKSFPQQIYITKSRGLQFRESPTLSAVVLGVLAKDEKLFCRVSQNPEIINSKKGTWKFCITSEKHQGWVFDAYIDKVDSSI